MIYRLYQRIIKRIIKPPGPKRRLITSHDDFKSAWAEALSMFEYQGWIIVGCHLSPEYPHDPAYAEFFVVKGTEHRTYFIQAEREAR